MRPWGERSDELASLLNPWLSAMVIESSVCGYEGKKKAPMPLSLAFLIIPLVMHRETFEAMPANSNAKFSNWVLDNARPLAGFGIRAKEMVPFVREGIVLGASLGILQFEDGCLKSTRDVTTRAGRVNSTLAGLASKSKRIGSMWATAGPPATIYALLGVAP